MKFRKKLTTFWRRTAQHTINLCVWVRKNAKFLIALITAAALIWQNCTLRKQVNLHKIELQAEQKPIIYRGVGEYQESEFLNNKLIVTEHIVNIGGLPAYNVTRRYSIINSPEYPMQHFIDLMNEDSLYRNILLPGIPRIDTISIDILTNCGEVTKEQFAYELFENNDHVYIHFWTEYKDIAARFYVLQQTFELHGRSDSTLFWSAYHAVDEEFEDPY